MSKSPLQALDLHIAAECFMREFWDLVQYPVQLPPDLQQRFAAFGISGAQDLPHCAHLPDSSRICFVRANEVWPALPGAGILGHSSSAA